MQMVRLSLTKRQNSAGSEMTKKEDLDEKIRRIREENKKREQRFKEVEQDKKLSMKSICIDDTQPLKTMKGVQSSRTNRKTKGRGQRLVEMSNQPLKAEQFKTRTENRWGFCKPEITLINNCRSSIRKKIKTKDIKQSAKLSEAKNDDSSKVENISNSFQENQCNEIPQENKIVLEEQNQSDPSIKDINNVKLQDIEQKITEDNSESHKEQNNTTETDLIMDNGEKQENRSDSNTSPAQLGAEDSTKKNNKPPLKVEIKKTVSSSSFEETMTMFSPLDLPQNWGDIDFSDDDLPEPSIWNNYN